MSLTNHLLTNLPPFLNKIKKIRDTFVPSANENDVHPPSDAPKITVFTQLSEDVVNKIIACKILGQHFSLRNVVT